jgi:hypothetical protein
MLYPFLLEHYVWFCLLLLAVTWFTRSPTPEKRTNFIYGYGLIATLGVLLALDWMAGVIFGLLVLEVGRVFKAWLDKKANNLKQ